jgi:hypothetical protein
MSPVVRSVVAQYASVLGGFGYAWLAVRGRLPHPSYFTTAAAGVALLLVEGIRGIRRPSDRLTRWTAFGLAGYSLWIMHGEVFLFIGGQWDILWKFALLIPYLFAIARLARSPTWYGLLGASLFLATSVAMVTVNASTERGGTGFMESWIV